ALQALSLMNSSFMEQQSKTFATRVATDCGGDAGCRIERAYRLALARAPRANEVAMAKDFLAQGGLVEDFCLALLNRNEFVYVP
ncbi:MAG: DUF1553 domain-containing protein, partial [Bryobacterales bacterium]|nr:DUF1553 domain-containing protein [Bryobacterales bacterium]